MLPWWGWALLWVVLLVGSGALLGWMGWQVWGKVKRLMKEIERAGELVTVLEARSEALSKVGASPSAVTQDPFRVREEYRVQREEAATRRAARRAARLPPWARVH
ncbi:MAG: hypothetical protein ABIQ61_13010 [Ornithinibacter sp.]